MFDKSQNILYNDIVIEKERDLYPPEYKGVLGKKPRLNNFLIMFNKVF